MPVVSGDPESLVSRVTSSRYEQLDGLRGIAALAVMCFHYFAIYPDVFERDVEPMPWAEWGYYGVQLFFVVSGFVIFMTLERARTPWEFVARRAIRLYPTYWTAVLISACVIATGVFPDTGVTQHAVGAKQLIANLTMLHSYLNIAHLDGVYWTLAYEVSFYAWACLLLIMRQHTRVERICALYLVFRSLLVASQAAGITQIGVRICTLLLLDYGHFFVVGVMFYRLRTQGTSMLRHALIALGCLSEAMNTKPQSQLVLIGIVAVFYALHAGRMAWLRARLLVWFGSISYALYALHEVPGWALMRVLRGHGVSYGVSSTIVVVSALATAWLITAYLEAPAMAKLKSLLLGRDSRVAEPGEIPIQRETASDSARSAL